MTQNGHNNLVHAKEGRFSNSVQSAVIIY